MVMTKNHKRNEDFKLLERRRDVAKYYLMGKIQWDIALLMRDNYPGLTQKTVSDDLAWCTEHWLNDIGEKVDRRKAIELAKINHLETLALEGYANSLKGQDYTRKISERAPLKMLEDDDKPLKSQVKGKNGKKFPKIREAEDNDTEPEEHTEMKIVKQVVEHSKRGSSGDPRFLTQVQWCIEMRLKLFGIKMGEDINISNTNNVFVDFDSMYRRKMENETDPLEEKLKLLEMQPVNTPPPVFQQQYETVDAEIVPTPKES